VVSGPRPRAFSAFCFLLCLLLLPLRVIYEINPDWPFLSWLYTSIVVLATLYAFYLAGGWPWVRHFAFPVAFILVAVAWPWRIEKGLTQGLMRTVASLTVELLGWLDIPAIQRGNLIELGNGTVGIDEACSGIRSFQSSLMAALLMGELYRLRFWPRAGLLAAGIGFGFCFNLVRTSLLSWQANAHGLEAIEKWHDPAGLSITVACFFCLWAIAVLITKWTKRHAPSSPAKVSSPVVSSPVVSSPVVRRYLLVVGCWAVFILGCTELWYRAHELKSQGAFYWSASFPTNSPSYAAIEINEKVRRNLRHDVGLSGSWKEEDGTEWSGHYFRWNPKSVQSIISARQHRPDVCLPASGLQQVEDAGVEYVNVSGLKLPFRKYTYSLNGAPLHVFFCQWEDGSEQQVAMWWSKKAERVRAALVGRRNLGQQSLEFILRGYGSLTEAEQALKKHLPDLISVSKPSKLATDH
jgi:exosortase